MNKIKHIYINIYIIGWLYYYILYNNFLYIYRDKDSDTSNNNDNILDTIQDKYDEITKNTRRKHKLAYEITQDMQGYSYNVYVWVYSIHIYWYIITLYINTIDIFYLCNIYIYI